VEVVFFNSLLEGLEFLEIDLGRTFVNLFLGDFGIVGYSIQQCLGSEDHS
jgi:hypothetical protein